MAVTEYPYDASPAYRPSLDDLGGDAKLDDDTYAPGAGEPCSAEWNNFARINAAACRMLPTVSLTINFDGGDPYIESLSSMATEISASDFVLTDGGTGTTTITWAAGLLPAMVRPPRSYSHEQGRIAGAWETSAVSVLVETRDAGATLQDARVTVDIF